MNNLLTAKIFKEFKSNQYLFQSKKCYIEGRQNEDENVSDEREDEYSMYSFHDLV